MENKIFIILGFVFLINLASAGLPICLDTNSQDISKIPCVGFTVPINCSDNVTAFNSTDPSINFTFETDVFVDGIYNFTLNLTEGGYELVDCENNTATIFVGLVEQGFGVTIFSIIFPSILLTLLSLFVSGRMFSKMSDDDEEQHKRMEENHSDPESFVPRNRLLPIVFMLFAFIPMIFMIGFVNNHLEEYLPTANITTFFGTFYILFSYVFYFVFLISFVVWLSSFIKLKRVMRDLDDIE